VALAACGDTGSDLQVEKVAGRVASIRGLSFEHVPEARVRPQAEILKLAKRHAQRALQALPPRKRARRAEEERIGNQLPVLVGLVDRAPSDEAILGLVQLDGLYDEVDHRVYLIKGTFKGKRQTEVTLAHELTHALDEQRYGPAGALISSPVSDASDAARAIREGSATLTQVLYERRYLGERAPIEAQLVPAAPPPGAGRLQRLAMYELGFVYSRGTRFLHSLYTRWGIALVNRAVRHPPVTTASILEPSRWPRRDRPLAPAGRVAPEAGWQRAFSGTFGAAATYELLFLAAPEGVVSRLARDWRGGTVEVWQRPAAVRAHAKPTRATSVVALRWRWRTSAAAADARGPVDLHLRDAFGARPAGNGVWRWRGGGAALKSRGTTTTLVIAPTLATAAATTAGA
jgi:hypothetical protein